MLDTAPVALQTPPAKVDVTAPEVAVTSVPALASDSVSETVNGSASTSATTMPMSANASSST